MNQHLDKIIPKARELSQCPLLSSSFRQTLLEGINAPEREINNLEAQEHPSIFSKELENLKGTFEKVEFLASMIEGSAFFRLGKQHLEGDDSNNLLKIFEDILTELQSAVEVLQENLSVVVSMGGKNISYYKIRLQYFLSGKTVYKYIFATSEENALEIAKKREPEAALHEVVK